MVLPAQARDYNAGLSGPALQWSLSIIEGHFNDDLYYSSEITDVEFSEGPITW